MVRDHLISGTLRDGMSNAEKTRSIGRPRRSDEDADHVRQVFIQNSSEELTSKIIRNTENVIKSLDRSLGHPYTCAQVLEHSYFSSCIAFTDEAKFHICGYVNQRICVILESYDPQRTFRT